MKIAIIGHGNVGGALAKKWKEAGHDVVVGARNPESDKLVKLKESLPDITIQTITEASKEAEVLLVATPPQIVLDLIKTIGDVSDKVIIDATNAIAKKPAPYPTAYHAFADLTDASVVKCFNTTGFENMENPNYGDIVLDMFSAGDNDHAKEVATQLAQDCGFEQCYDFGGSEKVELLEKFALSWINLAIMQGYGRGIGMKVLKR